VYRARASVRACVWEPGTGELAASQADIGRTIPCPMATLYTKRVLHPHRAPNGCSDNIAQVEP
jgi:hypothetical protein